MNKTIKLNQERHTTIDIMPVGNLRQANPNFTVSDKSAYVIETDLTAEEHALIDDSVKRYRDNPSSFITLSELKRRLG
jgi:hypothetical protein